MDWAVQVNLISNLEGPDFKKVNTIDGGKLFTIVWMRMQRANLRIVKGSHTITAIECNNDNWNISASLCDYS